MLRSLWLVVMLVLALAPAVAEAQTLYGCTFDGTTSQLISIDTTTGAGTVIGPITPTMPMTGIAFQGAKLYVYATGATLTELDPSTGKTLNTVNMGGSPPFGGEGDIAFRSDGIGFITNNQMWTFDLTLPKFGNVTATSPGTDGLSFDGADVLYGIKQGGGQLITIDTTTGTTTPVGNTGIGGAYNLGGLAFAPNGKLYAALSGPAGPSDLYEIDACTGKGTLIGAIGINGVCGITIQGKPPPPATCGTGVLVAPTTVAVTEGGATGSYTVVLSGAPSATVTITISPGAQVTVAPTSLSFTPANWSAPQTVTVTAIDDKSPEGAHSDTITHTSASADTSYNGITVAGVTVNVTDNDSGGGGGQVLYGVTFTSAEVLTIDTKTGKGTLVGKLPTGTQAFGLSYYNSKLYVFDGKTKNILEIDPSNAQVLTTIDVGIAGLPQPALFIEGDLAIRSDGVGFLCAGDSLFRFTLSAGSASVVGTVQHVDGLAFNAAGTLFGLADASTGHSIYTIDPATATGTVVGKTGISIVGFNTAGLAFDAADTFYGITAPFPNGDGMLCTIDAKTGAATNVGLTGFKEVCGLTFGTAPAGGAGATVTPSAGSTNIAEGGATDSYDVVLNTAPTANVTITLNPDAQVTVAPATLTFTPANWMTPQTVTVTAVDDSKVEGTHTGTITHSAASADTAYNGLTISNVTVSITDNDSGGTTPPPPTKSGSGFGEGAYWNTPGPRGSEGACVGEGSYLLASLPTPGLLGPFAAPQGHALVFRSAPARLTATPADTPSSSALFAASAALLLGGSLMGGVWLGRGGR